MGNKNGKFKKNLYRFHLKKIINLYVNTYKDVFNEKYNYFLKQKKKVVRSVAFFSIFANPFSVWMNGRQPYSNILSCFQFDGIAHIT